MIPVFKTDQTDCFDVDGVSLSCPGSGQDGELRVGASWPTPRFEVQSETVYDRLSGLMWTLDAGLSRFPLTWMEALDFVGHMNRESLFGYQDWKLPGRGELFGLISHAQINPALPFRAPFDNVFPGYYWTSTTCSRLADQAWYVHLGGGRIFRGMKHGSYMVWPVRYHRKPAVQGGAKTHARNLYATTTSGHYSDSGPERRFINENRFIIHNHTVHDRLTGLIWMNSTQLPADPTTWPAALDVVRGLNAETTLRHDDWRLPNIRELESLVDIRHHTPALADNHPFGRVPQGCWSSTTSVYEPCYAWVVYMQDGAVGVGYKRHPTFYAWAVRGGII